MRQARHLSPVTAAMSDDEFLEGFESTSYPPELWTHRAHLRMAWLYLEQHPFAEAMKRIREGIQRYNGAHGKADGYHETVTTAFTRLIQHRRSLGRSPSFEVFASQHHDLFARSPGVLSRYYRGPTLASREARTRFVEPDVAPLPPIE